MGVIGKTRAERVACEDVETKIRRLLDTLSVLKKLDDELGKLRGKYAGGMAVDTEGLGTVLHDILVEVFERDT